MGQTVKAYYQPGDAQQPAHAGAIAIQPPKKFEIKTDDVVSIHRVVGSGEF
ncbi:MAG: hypothetical protein ABI963_06800 [Rhizomicrobium sp.]